MYPIFNNMSFDEIVEFTIDEYSMNNGRDKLHTIYEKVMTNNKLSGLLSKSRFLKIAPSAKDVMTCICSTAYFMFRSNSTQICAAVLFLKRWNEEVNKELYLLDEEQLKKKAIACYSIYNH